MKIYSLQGVNTSSFTGNVSINGSLSGSQLLFLSADDAVIVTESLFRLPTFTTIDVLARPGDEGDIYYDIGSGSYKAYNNGYQEIILSGDTASYASQALSSSYSSLSSQSVNNNTSSGSLSFWQGNQTEYDAISSSADPNTIYFVV